MGASISTPINLKSWNSLKKESESLYKNLQKLILEVDVNKNAIKKAIRKWVILKKCLEDIYEDEAWFLYMNSKMNGILGTIELITNKNDTPLLL